MRILSLGRRFRATRLLHFGKRNAGGTGREKHGVCLVHFARTTSLNEALSRVKTNNQTHNSLVANLGLRTRSLWKPPYASAAISFLDVEGSEGRLEGKRRAMLPYSPQKRVGKMIACPAVFAFRDMLRCETSEGKSWRQKRKKERRL